MLDGIGNQPLLSRLLNEVVYERQHIGASFLGTAATIGTIVKRSTRTVEPRTCVTIEIADDEIFTLQRRDDPNLSRVH